jgi:hypothetical protein
VTRGARADLLGSSEAKLHEVIDPAHLPTCFAGGTWNHAPLRASYLRSAECGDWEAYRTTWADLGISPEFLAAQSSATGGGAVPAEDDPAPYNGTAQALETVARRRREAAEAAAAAAAMATEPEPQPQPQPQPDDE